MGAKEKKAPPTMSASDQVDITPLPYRLGRSWQVDENDITVFVFDGGEVAAEATPHPKGKEKAPLDDDLPKKRSVL